MDFFSPPILILFTSLLALVWILHLSRKSMKEQLRHRAEVAASAHKECAEHKQTLLISGQIHAEQLERLSCEINALAGANEDLRAEIRRLNERRDVIELRHLEQCREFVIRLATTPFDIQIQDQEARDQLLREARALSLPEPSTPPTGNHRGWFRKRLGLPAQQQPR